MPFLLQCYTLHHNLQHAKVLPAKHQGHTIKPELVLLKLYIVKVEIDKLAGRGVKGRRTTWLAGMVGN